MFSRPRLGWILIALALLISVAAVACSSDGNGTVSTDNTPAAARRDACLYTGTIVTPEDVTPQGRQRDEDSGG
jgi:hypothetical protein